ncbi:MAG: CoA-binding protein [Armatimonadota bacterium]
MEPAIESSEEGVRQILTASKIIAVVGLSPTPYRPSHEVASYLKDEGYRIIPVNPKISETLGEKAYPGLREVPEPVDIVQIFRRPEHVPAIVEDAIAIGAKVVWMQLGIINEDAAARALAAGLQVVMNTCMATAHNALRAKGRL